MKSKLLAIGAVAAIAAGNTNAGVISGTNLVALSGDVMIAANNVPLVTGVATAGTFAVGFDVAAAAAAQDFTALLANYTILGSAAIGDTTAILGADYAGLYSVNADYGAPGGAPGTEQGQVLYTMFGNGADLASSLGFGLVQYTETIGPDVPAPDSNNLVLNPAGTSLGFPPLIGTVGATTVDFSGVGGAPDAQVATLNLVIIPEPGVAALGLIGFLGLLRRRR